MMKKWLINVSEEPDMINTTLDNGRSLRQLIVGVSLFLAFQTIRKSQKYDKFILTPNQDLLHARSFIRDGALSSVELSGELSDARDSPDLTLELA